MAPSDEDQDVANERKRVLRGSGRRDLLRLENLTKVTRPSEWTVYGAIPSALIRK